ncbi:glutathione S-transferase family protein, partial [Acinetobacter sp. ANC 4636]
DGQAGQTGEGGFQAEKGRYHLYVALICPWASRTLIARELKGLTDIVSVSVVEPQLSDFGWRFGHAFSADQDSLNHKQYMHEIYTLADPNFTGRATVPVLWDKKRKTIVNNESSDIVRMFNSGFANLAQSDYELYPQKLQSEIDALNEQIYQKLNNGVYRAGFATTQIAYEHAVVDVFEMLEQLEVRLSQRRYLFGNELTETDIRLFVTLIRFDVAYHGLFKCNLKQLRNYPHLMRYVQDILMIPGVAQTVNFEHIKQGYYSIKSLNPLGIVPVGPEINFQLPV